MQYARKAGKSVGNGARSVANGQQPRIPGDAGKEEAEKARTSGSINLEQSKVNWKFLRSTRDLRFELSPGGLPEGPIWCSLRDLYLQGSCRCWVLGSVKVTMGAKQSNVTVSKEDDTAVLVMSTMVLRILLMVLLVGGGFQTVATVQLKRNHHKGHSVLNS